MNKMSTMTKAIDTELADGCFCSMDLSTDDAKARLFNAVSNPDKKLTECANMKIALKDVYIEPQVLVRTDENGNDTGEVEEVNRMVLIDDKGVSYTCCSKGVFNSLRRIIALYGMPNIWEKPIVITPINVSRGNRQFLNIKLG
jgi:hypothetical protein|nr:MAG TPA: Single stranded DNA binding protein [Caudoviricetes sp.]